MDFKERVEEKRRELVDTLLKYIETNPERWERGWYSVSNEPAFNPISQKRYKGLNAFYLYALSEMKGYKDPRWLTFKQAKDLGANVKQGEHSANILYWNLYDKSTKQSFSEETVKDLSEEERDKYFDDNVRPVLKYYQVFNAEQCDNMPEYKRTAEQQSMAEEERAQQNALIERVIRNSSAPISYGGNRAYYSPSEDAIRLPEIENFKSMQDYYATALHEIAHSTGHKSRLNRDIENTFGTHKYAKEELRAELASIFMQIDMGLSIEGNHFENHGAYLASWLRAVKKDVKEFYSASAEAEKISEYVARNYAHEKVITQEIQKEEHKEKIENKDVERQPLENKAEQVHHRPLLINFYSGPGAGKTTVSLELTAELKKAGFNVEYVSEYAKELVLENKAEMLKDQQHVIDEQYKRLDRYRDSVDIIVTDSPLLLGQVYGEGRISEEYHNQIRAYYDSFDNFNLWVTRGDEAYQQAGRVENLEQAKELDGRIKAMMKANKLYYCNYNRGEIAKTVNRIKKTYTRLYGNQKEEPIEENTKENEIKQDKQAEQVQQVGQVEQYEGAKSFILEIYKLNYSNDTLLSNELKKLGFEKDFRFNESNINIEAQAREEGHSNWLEDICYVGKNGETIKGLVGVNYNEFLNLRTITGITRLELENVSQEQFYAIANILRELGAVVDRNYDLERLREAIAEEDNTKENEKQQVKQAEQVQQADNKPLMIKSQVKGWDDWSTAEIKNQRARESAEWLIKNGLENEKDVKNAFHDYQTHDMADYIEDARKSAEKAIIRVAGKYMQHLEGQDKDNTKENEIKKDKQAEQVQQVEQVKPAEWREINLKKENIVKEYEKSIMIRVSDGEYSSFVFSAPKKLVKTNDKKGLIKLSVKEDWQYELKNNGLLVELNGSDLCAVFAGKEVGKSAKRIAPTYQNSRRLENIRENVPEEMKNMPNWCAYKTLWNEAKGKRDKQIYTPLWRNIELKEEQLTGKSGQNTLIKVLDGEYANFEFLAPTELIKKDEKSDLYNLAVKLEGQYQLKNNETLAKFSGKELCDVLGKSKLRWGSIDDPETWATFDKAMEFAIKNNCYGLSFAMDGNGISCIDLDKCIVLKGKLNDQDTTLDEGAMNDTAKKLISELNGYCETSVSGNGLHFFLKDDILNNNKYKNRVVLENGDEIEVYDDKRFMSITGNIRSNTNELTRCPSATTSWLREKLGARVTEQAKPKPSNTNRNQNIDMSDDAVIERIRRSKKGREFEELYRGGSVIGNRSQDDLKLLNILAFFTNGDEHQVERIFKQSGLYRPEKEKYLQHSIKTACATRYGSYGDNIKPRANQQSNGRR